MTAASFAGAASVRVALVTNIPAPYRLPVYARLAATAGIELKVFFCGGREPDRAWTLPPMLFAHEVLRERMIRWRGRYIHVNPGVVASLKHFAPDVVVTTGFNPTHLLAWRFACVRRPSWLAPRRPTSSPRTRRSRVRVKAQCRLRASSSAWRCGC